MNKKPYPPEIQTLINSLKNKPTAAYTYFDRNGDVCGCSLRYDSIDGKEISQRRYVLTDNGNKRWEAKSMIVPQPLYNLPELLNAPDKPVLIVEGEKTADSAMLISKLSEFVVVTWSGGANAYEKADWSPLDGRKKVVIWPDNDEAGIKAAKGIAKILYERNSK